MKSMIYLILIAFFTFSCQNSESKSTAIDSETRLSQFERAGYADLLIDKAGTYHAVFLESPAIGKPIFVYYCFSSNQGKSWSKPVTISNDGTGNGSSYPRIIQDGRGIIYAIWKRFGNPKSAYAIGETNLEGTGGYNIGTIYFSTLNAGIFSKPTMLADNEAMQISWFPAIDNAGNLHVLWSQISSESHKHSWNSYNFADYLRDAKISGNTILGITDYTTPSAPSYPGGAPPYNGWQNLRGYCDKSGKFRFIGEVLVDKIKTIMYFNGTKTSAVYQYPLYKEGNTFYNPAALLTDELGNDHVVFRPSSATLESEQIWDLNLSTNKTNVIASIQKQGLLIQGFQAVQGPNGEMAATIQAGGLSNTNESYGLFYKNGKWTTQALTNNGSKESFTYTEFKGYIGKNTYLSTLTKYNTNFISVAWNASGKKSMLMTLAANWSGLGFSTSSPSVIFAAID